MSVGVFALTVGALYFKFKERIWQKKSHAFVHLLCLTFLLSFTQTIAAAVDILWLLRYALCLGARLQRLALKESVTMPASESMVGIIMITAIRQRTRRR